MPVKVSACEYIKDAYSAILEAESEGLVQVFRYENPTPKMLGWINKTVWREYLSAEPYYKIFLEAKS